MLLERWNKGWKYWINKRLGRCKSEIERDLVDVYLPPVTSGNRGGDSAEYSDLDPKPYGSAGGRAADFGGDTERIETLYEPG